MWKNFITYFYAQKLIMNIDIFKRMLASDFHCECYENLFSKATYLA